MTIHPWAILTGLPPLLAILYLGWKVKREDAKKRDPFTEPLLRPPGESCRQKLNELNEEAINRIFWFIVPVIFAVAAFCAPWSIFGFAACSLLSLAATIVTSKRLLALRKDILNYQLGFDGVQIVGVECRLRGRRVNRR